MCACVRACVCVSVRARVSCVRVRVHACVCLLHQGGLAGICGHHNMRDVEKAALSGNADALLAEKIYVQRVRKYLGAYLVRLGGDLDALVFTGGVGAQSSRIRDMVCDGLARLGIALDPERNERPSPREFQPIISPDGALTKVLAVASNYEVSIALQSVSAVAEAPEHARLLPLQTAAQSRTKQQPRIGGAAGETVGPAGGEPPPPKSPEDSFESAVSGAAGLYLATQNYNDASDPMIGQVRAGRRPRPRADRPPPAFLFLQQHVPMIGWGSSMEHFSPRPRRPIGFRG